jgi:large subunit ribosomal protein L19
MISITFKDTALHIGDTIKVKNTIIEGDKTRVQAFQGILIAMSGRGENRTMTVRHIGPQGIGVERIWPVNSKTLVDIEVVKNAKNARRSKLYYLRDLKGKMATRV